MPIDDLTGRLRELGRIKLGEESGDRPRQLDTFRLTTRYPDLAEAVAAAYGGTVEPSGDGLEVVTDVSSLDVLLPPQDVAAGQFWEHWTAGGLQRRCTGTTMVEPAGDSWIATGPCLCSGEDGRICKPTTVLRVVLPNLPDLGAWRLVTRSMYAAQELPDAAALIARLAGDDLAPAVLAIEVRHTKRPGQGRRDFVVPVLRSRGTLAELIAGAVSARFLAVDPPEAASGPQRPQAALPAGEGPPAHNPRPFALAAAEAIAAQDAALHEAAAVTAAWADLARFLAANPPGETATTRYLDRDMFRTDEAIAALEDLEALMLTVRLWSPVDAGDRRPRSPLEVSSAKILGSPDAWRSPDTPPEDLRRFTTRAFLAAHAAAAEHRRGGPELAKALRAANPDPVEV